MSAHHPGLQTLPRYLGRARPPRSPDASTAIPPRDCWYVARGGTSSWLPLPSCGDSEQQSRRHRRDRQKLSEIRERRSLLKPSRAVTSSGQLTEPSLDEVDPVAGGRGEVQHEPGVLGEPTLDLWGLVRRAVVQHQVHVEVGGRPGWPLTSTGRSRPWATRGSIRLQTTSVCATLRRSAIARANAGTLPPPSP
jgi:hypothetical protein